MFSGARKSPQTLHDATLSPWPQSLGELPTSSLPDFGKRALDLVGSLFLLLATFPIFALIAILVAAEGNPVLCVHQRIGRGGKPFGCLNFRTLRADGSLELQAFLGMPAAWREWEIRHRLRNEAKVTRLEMFLFRYGLDELPQLLNVLRGEMSLVGPRPVIEGEFKQFYGSMAAAYLSVRPGVIGPWQVNGRSTMPYEGRVALDIAYANNHSFIGDLAILGQTIVAVLSRAGAD